MSNDASTGFEKVPAWLLEGAVLDTGKLLDPKGRWEIAWEPGGKLHIHKEGAKDTSWPPPSPSKGGLIIEVARRERARDTRNSGWLLVRLLSAPNKKVLWVAQAEVKQANRLAGLPWRDTGAAQTVRLEMLQTLLVVSKRAGLPVVDWEEQDAANRIEDSAFYKLWEKLPGTDNIMRAGFAGCLLWACVFFVLLFSGALSTPNPPQNLTPDYAGHFEICAGSGLSGEDTWTLTMSPSTQTLVFERVPFAVDWLLVGFLVVYGLFFGARFWETREEKRDTEAVVMWSIGIVFVLVGLAFLGSGTRITLQKETAVEESTMYGIPMWKTHTALTPQHTPIVSFPTPDDKTHQTLILSDGKTSDDKQPQGILLVESHDGENRPLSVVKEIVEGILRR